MRVNCGTTTLTNPGQVTDPTEYNYSGSAQFTVNTFTVSPPECSIIYSCSMLVGPDGYDLCNYSDELTTASFDTFTGDYSFTSTDFPTFKDQTITFETTVTSGNSNDYF